MARWRILSDCGPGRPERIGGCRRCCMTRSFRCGVAAIRQSTTRLLSLVAGLGLTGRFSFVTGTVFGVLADSEDRSSNNIVTPLGCLGVFSLFLRQFLRKGAFFGVLKLRFLPD